MAFMPTISPLLLLLLSVEISATVYKFPPWPRIIFQRLPFPSRGSVYSMPQWKTIIIKPVAIPDASNIALAPPHSFIVSFLPNSRPPVVAMMEILLGSTRLRFLIPFHLTSLFGADLQNKLLAAYPNTPVETQSRYFLNYIIQHQHLYSVLQQYLQRTALNQMKLSNLNQGQFVITNLRFATMPSNLRNGYPSSHFHLYIQDTKRLTTINDNSQRKKSGNNVNNAVYRSLPHNLIRPVIPIVQKVSHFETRPAALYYYPNGIPGVLYGLRNNVVSRVNSKNNLTAQLNDDRLATSQQHMLAINKEIPNTETSVSSNKIMITAYQNALNNTNELQNHSELNNKILDLPKQPVTKIPNLTVNISLPSKVLNFLKESASSKDHQFTKKNTNKLTLSDQGKLNRAKELTKPLRANKNMQTSSNQHTKSKFQIHSTVKKNSFGRPTSNGFLSAISNDIQTNPNQPALNININKVFSNPSLKDKSISEMPKQQTVNENNRFLYPSLINRILKSTVQSLITNSFLPANQHSSNTNGEIFLTSSVLNENQPLHDKVQNPAYSRYNATLLHNQPSLNTNRRSSQLNSILSSPDKLKSVLPTNNGALDILSLINQTTFKINGFRNAVIPNMDPISSLNQPVAMANEIAQNALMPANKPNIEVQNIRRILTMLNKYVSPSFQKGQINDRLSIPSILNDDNLRLTNHYPVHINNRIRNMLLMNRNQLLESILRPNYWSKNPSIMNSIKQQVSPANNENQAEQTVRIKTLLNRPLSNNVFYRQSNPNSLRIQSSHGSFNRESMLENPSTDIVTVANRQDSQSVLGNSNLVIPNMQITESSTSVSGSHGLTIPKNFIVNNVSSKYHLRNSSSALLNTVNQITNSITSRKYQDATQQGPVSLNQQSDLLSNLNGRSLKTHQIRNIQQANINDTPVPSVQNDVRRTRINHHSNTDVRSDVSQQNGQFKTVEVSTASGDFIIFTDKNNNVVNFESVNRGKGFDNRAKQKSLLDSPVRRFQKQVERASTLYNNLIPSNTRATSTGSVYPRLSLIRASNELPMLSSNNNNINNEVLVKNNNSPGIRQNVPKQMSSLGIPSNKDNYSLADSQIKLSEKSHILPQITTLSEKQQQSVVRLSELINEKRSYKNQKSSVLDVQEVIHLSPSKIQDNAKELQRNSAQNILSLNGIKISAANQKNVPDPSHQIFNKLVPNKASETGIRTAQTQTQTQNTANVNPERGWINNLRLSAAAGDIIILVDSSGSIRRIQSSDTSQSVSPSNVQKNVVLTSTADASPALPLDITASAITSIYPQQINSPVSILLDTVVPSIATRQQTRLQSTVQTDSQSIQQNLMSPKTGQSKQLGNSGWSAKDIAFMKMADMDIPYSGPLDYSIGQIQPVLPKSTNPNRRRGWSVKEIAYMNMADMDIPYSYAGGMPIID